MSPQRPPFLPIIEDHAIFVERMDQYDWVASSFDEGAIGAPSQDFLGVSIPGQYISRLFIGLMLILVLLLGRTGYLQGVEGGQLSSLSQHNKLREYPVSAKRGVLYDRNGVMLAGNIPNFKIQITAADLPVQDQDRSAEIDRVAAISGVASDQINELLKKSDRFTPVAVADQIPYDQALKLTVELASLPGVEVVVGEQRQYYTTGIDSLSHVLGYSGRISEDELKKQTGNYFLNDTIGKSGIELSYEAVLRGLYGKKQVEVDALGREKQIVAQEPAHDGSNITLTIDKDLQLASQQALQSVLKQFKTEKGVVIISTPKGEILSLVSLPGYDANSFVKGISQQDFTKLMQDPNTPLLNRAVAGEYPSGSTIKMIVAATALEKGVATLDMMVKSTGGIKVGGSFFPDWKKGGHGLTSVTKALAESVNTYFYIIWGGFEDKKGLGALALAEAFQRFGLGTITGLDLPVERSGFIPSPEWKERVKHEPWYVGDTYHIAIGQGDILVTPLQVNEFTAFFANKGVSYVPHLVQKMTDPVTKKDEVVQPKKYKEKLVSDATVSIIRQGLRRAVTDGSARRLSTLPVAVAGKTGTAQWGGKDKRPHAWFTGWAPFDDPQIIITVLVEEGEEGSRSAISVAQALLGWYFQPETRANWAAQMGLAVNGSVDKTFGD